MKCSIGPVVEWNFGEILQDMKNNYGDARETCMDSDIAYAAVNLVRRFCYTGDSHFKVLDLWGIEFSG